MDPLVTKLNLARVKPCCKNICQLKIRLQLNFNWNPTKPRIVLWARKFTGEGWICGLERCRCSLGRHSPYCSLPKNVCLFWLPIAVCLRLASYCYSYVKLHLICLQHECLWKYLPKYCTTWLWVSTDYFGKFSLGFPIAQVSRLEQLRPTPQLKYRGHFALHIFFNPQFGWPRKVSDTSFCPNFGVEFAYFESILRFDPWYWCFAWKPDLIRLIVKYCGAALARLRSIMI